MDVCTLERKAISYSLAASSASRAKVPDAAGGEGLSIGELIKFKQHENVTMDSEKNSFSFFFKPSCPSSALRCVFFSWSGRITIWYFQSGTFEAVVATTEGFFDVMLLQKSNESHKDEDQPDKSDRNGKIGLKLSIISPSRNKHQNKDQGHLEGFYRIGIKYDATVSPPSLTIYVDGIPTSVNGSWPGIRTTFKNYVEMQYGTVTCFHYSEKVENEEFFETGNLQECSEYLHQ